MSVFRRTVDLTSQTSFPTDPQVVAPFEPLEVAVVNEETGVADVFLSFDGVEEHGRLAAGRGVTFKQRTRKVWLRRAATGAAPTRVAVVVES